MQSHGPLRLHLPTFDDIRRLLAGLNAVHAAGGRDRAAVLAGRIADLTGAHSAAVFAGDAGRPPARLAVFGADPGRATADAGVPIAVPIDGAAATDVSSRAVPAASPPAPAGGRKRIASAAAVIADAHPADSHSADSHSADSPSGDSHPADAHIGDSHTLHAAVPRAGAPAAVHSVRRGAGRVSVLACWRPTAFGVREQQLLRLLHPAVAWAFTATALRPGLSAVSERVFELMLVGLPEKAIAHRLGRSAHTIHSHVKRVYRHYGVCSRPQLLARVYDPRGQ